jgi:hypothetical protein
LGIEFHQSRAALSSISHAKARNKPKAPGHRLPAPRVGDLVRLGVPLMGFIMVEK